MRPRLLDECRRARRSAPGIVVADSGADAGDFVRAEVQADALPRLTCHPKNASSRNLHDDRLRGALHDAVDRAGVQRSAHDATQSRAAGVRDQLPRPVAVRVLDQIRRVRPERQHDMQQAAKERVFSRALYLIDEWRPLLILVRNPNRRPVPTWGLGRAEYLKPPRRQTLDELGSTCASETPGQPHAKYAGRRARQASP